MEGNGGTSVTECGWWVGPIWKLDGETCVCIKPEGHDEKEGHECSCGSWFAGCGQPKNTPRRHSGNAEGA